jgi:hypothetical protein
MATREQHEAAAALETSRAEYAEGMAEAAHRVGDRLSGNEYARIGRLHRARAEASRADARAALPPLGHPTRPD